MPQGTPSDGISPAGGGPPGYGMGYGGAPTGVDPTLWNWFVAVNADRSGQISALELHCIAQWKLVPVQPGNLQTNDRQGPTFAHIFKVYIIGFRSEADYPSSIRL